MERQYVTKNNRERERLTKLVNEITDNELKLVIYKEGWTIAAMLVHMAFWDNYATALLKRWKKDRVSPSLHEWNEINDALLPLALNIPPRTAAKLAVFSAHAADSEAEQSTPEFIRSVEALKEPLRLNRSLHRKAHLDEIDAFLKARRDKK
jgi:hypothetical protein